MTPIELRSRRESLGLGQAALAVVLGVAQNSVSAWEKGRTRIPAGVVEEINRLEDRVDHLIDRAIDALENTPDASVLIVYPDDASFWHAHPDMDGMPAVVHRVAMARAAREADNDVELVDVSAL